MLDDLDYSECIEEESVFGSDFSTEFIKEIKAIENDEEYNKCCSQYMILDNESRLLCEICGNSKEQIIDMGDELPSLDCFINVTGVLAFKYRKSAYTATKEQYKRFRSEYILSKIHDMNNSSKTIKISDQIICKARDNCIQLLNQRTYRNEVLKEIIAACINAACVSEKIFHKENEIAKFVGLKSNSFPTGYSIITNAISQNKMSEEIKLNIREFDDVVKFYFNNLDKLDKKYIDLAIEMCNVTIKENILTKYIMTTKIIGTLWCIILSTETPITDVEYEKIFNCKKATFTKYYIEMTSYSRIFTPILNKYELKFKEPKVKTKKSRS